MTAAPLPPGGTIGMLGGGQLGRMTALAAARLGYRTHVFTPEPDSPAAQVTDRSTLSSFADREALIRFAAAVDVVTFEFENVPHDAVAFLAGRRPARPGPAALAVCQDRLAEKRFCAAAGIATAPFAAVAAAGDLDAALAATGLPAVLKTNRLGYDGKGQAPVRSAAEAEAAWHRLGAVDCILEGFVPFERELSVIAARDLAGTVSCYPAVENRHRAHILAETIAPARLDDGTAAAAEAIATTLIRSLDIVGLLAVELFLTGDGRLLVNELAPRPHNSGHWTMDACAVSQFDQFVRAVCGLPLAPIGRHADAVMTNLLGDDIESWLELAADPTAHLHLYGKAEARPGRKMGHVNRLYPLGKGPAMNPPAPPGADRTAPAGGVELTLRGAAPGIDKTRLARLLRDGGHEQDKSIQLASLILAGREVRVRLGQFDTPAAARAALREIGVEEVLA